jgi:hypothetical protein
MAVLTALRRRPVLSAALLYALLAIAFVSPALMPGKTLSASDYLWSVAPWAESRPAGVAPFGSNFDMLDQAFQFQPGWQYAVRHLPDVPLWNPHIMAGHTFVGNFQSALFSPFTAPLYVLGLWDSLAWMAILKLFAAAFGTFLLGRALGMRFGGALLAGAVYGFGFYLVAWLGWSTASVWAWIPWLFLLADMVVRRPGPGPVAGLAVVTAFQFFGGHPESCFHVIFATVVFFALRAWQLRAGKRSIAAFAAALALGTTLAAVTLLPFLEAVLESDELTDRTANAPDKISLKFLFGALLPDYWGRPTEEPILAFVNNRAFYAGALTLMLALAALVIRPTRERIVIAAAGLICIATVTGIPPFHQIVNALPVFTTTHNARLAIFYLLAIALLAGFGLDELTGRSPPPARRRVLLWACAALLVAPLVWLAVGTPGPSDVWPAIETAWLFMSPPDELEVIRLASLLLWLTFAGAALALVAGRLRGRLAPGLFAGLAVALVVLDLFRVGVGLNPAIDEDDARQPATGAIEYLQERRPARFVGASRAGQQGLLPLEPNVAMRYGLYDARGYDFPLEARYSELWETYVSAEEGIVPPTRLAPINERSLRALSVLGVTDVVTAPDDPPLRQRGLRVAYDGSDANVYENARALPRAFVVSGQQVVTGEDEALTAVMDPRFDGRRVAVVEERLDGLPEGVGDPAGDAEITEYEPDRVEVVAESPGEALLVLGDVHYPGWEATVDGREVPIERVDYLLRGVRIGPGTHEVEFRYEPLSWRLGWVLSLLALAIVAVLCFRAWTRPGSQS